MEMENNDYPNRLVWKERLKIMGSKMTCILLIETVKQAHQKTWKTTTSNVTGRHRGLKQKLRAGYRAPSVQQMCYVRSVIFLPIGRRGPV